MPMINLNCPECGYQSVRQTTFEQIDKRQDNGGYRCQHCNHKPVRIEKRQKLFKDGFEPGYQESIGEYCRTRQEYIKRLKELGLRELGPGEKVTESKTESNYFDNEDMIKFMVSEGFDLSGREIAAIRSGEFFTS